jgi:hypothetical protein
MEIEREEAKINRNRLRRGFGYDTAALVFEDPVIEWRDVRKRYARRHSARGAKAVSVQYQRPANSILW